MSYYDNPHKDPNNPWEREPKNVVCEFCEKSYSEEDCIELSWYAGSSEKIKYVCIHCNAKKERISNKCKVCECSSDLNMYDLDGSIIYLCCSCEEDLE